MRGRKSEKLKRPGQALHRGNGRVRSRLASRINAKRSKVSLANTAEQLSDTRMHIGRSRGTDKFGALQPQETILGILGEYVEPGQKIWSGGLVRLLGDLRFSAAASRIALSRVVARGLLQPSRHGKLVYYTITPRLASIHEEGHRQLLTVSADGHWDGNWTLVWYSVPEEQRLKRARLSRWLKFQGFGALQDGTWIAPGKKSEKIAPLVEKLGLEDRVIVFAGKVADSPRMQRVVDLGWNLGELRKMCDAFVSELAPLRRQRAVAKLEPRDAFVLRTRVIEMFRQITTEDPRLPDAALGERCQRREAIKLFQEIRDALFARAKQHFSRCASPAENGTVAMPG